MNQSVRWRKAKDLHDYFDAREKHATPNNQLTDQFRRWLVWARHKADWYDPFIESKDKLLQNVEKDHPDLEKPEPVLNNDYSFESKNWFQKSFYHKR